jgi:hypothetical protein
MAQTAALPQRLHRGVASQMRYHSIRLHNGWDHIRLLADILYEKNRRTKTSKAERDKDRLRITTTSITTSTTTTTTTIKTLIIVKLSSIISS